jgi:NAD-dependent dihydropyrimidine dehydrogenase PreA subunit
VIEIVSATRCIGCGNCVRACPMDVFDPGPAGVPVVARVEDCETCFLCELYCPVDALFVAPLTHPVGPDSPLRDEERVARSGLLGSYRRQVGWGQGRIPGARLAVGPPIAGPEQTDPPEPPAPSGPTPPEPPAPRP